jgi:hypothetical protein
MEENKSKPFVCLDVNEKSTLLSVTKRIEELFPNTIVRLKIQGNYSPFFYLGKNKWAYKPKLKKPVKRFTVKVFLNDKPENFLEKDQILMLQHLNVNFERLKVLGDVYLLDKELSGLFFTDDEHIVIDQSIIDDAKALSYFFVEDFDCKIVLDLLNELNNGIIVLKTTKQIFGINND